MSIFDGNFNSFYKDADIRDSCQFCGFLGPIDAKSTFSEMPGQKLYDYFIGRMLHEYNFSR